ncbi:MAG: hypothetical protein V7609_2119 [Verrucomicrobiota bacterium]
MIDNEKIIAAALKEMERLGDIAISTQLTIPDALIVIAHLQLALTPSEENRERFPGSSIVRGQLRTLGFHRRNYCVGSCGLGYSEKYDMPNLCYGSRAMIEPLVMTPRMLIKETTSPAPRWSGVKFLCLGCLMTNQLEAADVCEPSLTTSRSYFSPECPTPGCGRITEFETPAPTAEELRGLLEVGLEPEANDDPPTPVSGVAGAAEQGDWNAS